MERQENIIIPPWVFDIQYNYDVNPENPETDLITTGSNCQVFSYELLRMNGLEVPNLWSDQMWDDEEYSTIINNDFLPWGSMKQSDLSSS